MSRLPGRRRPSDAGDIVIRPMGAGDVDWVHKLFADYAAAQFEENFSYDRWGPGVPVPYEDGIVEAETQQIDPSLAVRERLARLVDSTVGFVLLADRAGEVAGFVATSLLPASVLERELVGIIDDLYVVPGLRRRGTGSRLAAAATARLRRQGALLLRVQIARGARDAASFWDAQPDWAHDVRTYHSYQ